jgi:hypothetical protein
VHSDSNDGVNKDLEKRINEAKDCGISKKKSGTPIGSEGISTLGQIYQEGK